MKSALLAAITCFAIAGFAIGASTPPPAQKKAVTPAKKATAPPAAVARKGSPPAKTAARTPVPTPAKTPVKTAGRPTTTPTATRRYYYRQPTRTAYRTANYRAPQASPSSDRFREIQDALAAKGYLKAPSSGVWDKDSMDAMQRFQKDQNLDATGKLTARSLSALGLGPKTPPASPLDPVPTAAAHPTEAAPF